jgi:hypothetical protein
MIDTIATRRMTLNGTVYAKGDKVPMPLQQFTDLESTGLVERAPTDKKAAAKTKAAPSKSSDPAD